mgnify:CR=1 FL=1
MATARIMEQISHVVLLMLENRSLDNLLGWLYDGVPPPQRIVPAGSGAAFDGVAGRDCFNEFEGRKLPVTRGTEQAAQPLRVPRLDPNEPFDHVTVQLFADAKGKMPKPLPPGTPAPMKGFAYDFDSVYESWAELGEVMGAYRREQLPALGGLARAYAVSDRWFSSVPTQTNPNRAFSLCGTSLGRVKNLHETAVEQFQTKTLWNALPPDFSWGIYYKDLWTDGKCFTEYTFPQIDVARKAARFGEIDTMDMFFTRAKGGMLPAFTYIEPAWGYGKGLPDTFIGKQGDDYHPPTWVGPGEAFVNAVYDALTSNAIAWSKTLFIVTFDEHGGTYDHVDPGWGAVKPDQHSGPNGFQFDRYGVRVPTVMASPYIPAGTVFRAETDSKHPYPYDHTSLIASILKWRGIDPAGAGLGKRVAVAPTFESVLSDTARSDVPHFKVTPDYAEQGGGATDFANAEGVPIPIVKQAVDDGGSVEDIEARLRAWKAEHGGG